MIIKCNTTPYVFDLSGTEIKIKKPLTKKEVVEIFGTNKLGYISSTDYTEEEWNKIEKEILEICND